MAIKLFFTGDVVISKPSCHEILTDEIIYMIQNYDVVCCNLEAPIISKTKNTKAAKIGPSLSQNDIIVSSMCHNGFNLFALANNHIMDYGIEGLSRTIEMIEDNKAHHIGASINQEKYCPYVFKKDNMTIGIINVAENGFGTSIDDRYPGYAWFGADQFRNNLKKLINECDHTIVISHGGAEGWTFPLPEYRKLYQSWIDQGVSLVIGHHAHVPQGWEHYRGGYIYYSLGNFAFDKGRGIQDPKTICVSVIIDENGIKSEPIYTEFTNDGVIICRDKDFSLEIENRRKILESAEYITKVNEKVVEIFEKQYIDYYKHIFNCYDGGIKQWIKTMYFKILKHQNISDLWLYHNLCIETHYWICRRAADLRNYR